MASTFPIKDEESDEGNDDEKNEDSEDVPNEKEDSDDVEDEGEAKEENGEERSKVKKKCNGYELFAKLLL